jgi:hypothetical protein
MVQNDGHRHAQPRDGRAGRAFFVGVPGGPHGGGTPRSITGPRLMRVYPKNLKFERDLSNYPLNTKLEKLPSELVTWRPEIPEMRYAHQSLTEC